MKRPPRRCPRTDTLFPYTTLFPAYVDRVLPDEFEPQAGPFLASGDVIDDATTQPDVEQLAEQAAAVVGALTADDIGATVDAAAEGLGGRGEVLNELVRDAGLVAGTDRKSTRLNSSH